jgi:hypothetical protein
MPEEFVSAVDEMYDHFPGSLKNFRRSVESGLGRSSLKKTCARAEGAARR